MNPLDAGLIVAGLALLALGGEGLVRGATGLAMRMGISALVVGLTVVSSATSAPELAVSTGAVLSGNPELALGNVVGSNIANILLILGISALLLPLAVKRRLVRLDLPFMVTISVLLLVLALDGGINGWDGAILLATLAAHAVVTVLVSRREKANLDGEGQVLVPEIDAAARTPLSKSLLLVAGGVGLLVLGATILVEGATNLAAAFGISSVVIGLTVVAVGTSLPELAVTVVAVRRGERDLAVGNVVGSNIVNIGVVLGLPALISADGIPVPPANLALDIPLMLAAAVALLPVAFTGFTIRRWEGALFLGLYGAYTGFVILAATEHAALAGFTAIMAWFVLPITAVTLVAFSAYEAGLHKGRREASGDRGPGG